jgi:hypothetical protein
MPFFSRYARISLALTLLVAGQTATAFAGDPGWTSSQKAASWTGLIFYHAGMLGKLTVPIQIQSPAPMTDGLLARMGAGFTGSLATAKEMKLMAVEMKAEGLFFLNEQYAEKIWFHAGDGRAYRRIRWRKGGDPWVKIYAWTEKGVRRQKIQPAGREESKQDPVKWTKTTESFYPHPPDTVSSEVISDPALLLYLLSALDPLNLKSPFEIRVFGKEQLHLLTCRREKSLPLTVSFKTHSSSGVAGTNTTITPFVFSIEAESPGSQVRNPETFSLLGLQKNIRIYLDPSTHLPVRVSGRNSIWGELILDLSDVRLD